MSENGLTGKDGGCGRHGGGVLGGKEERIFLSPQCISVEKRTDDRYPLTSPTYTVVRYGGEVMLRIDEEGQVQYAKEQDSGGITAACAADVRWGEEELMVALAWFLGSEHDKHPVEWWETGALKAVHRVRALFSGMSWDKEWLERMHAQLVKRFLED